MYTNNWPTVDINLVLDVSSNKLGFPMMASNADIFDIMFFLNLYA